MKNIYLIQYGATFGDSNTSAFLPYSAGCLAAYAWSKQDIAESYELKKIVYSYNGEKALVESLEEPFLVGFSCYVWNYDYCISSAKAIKNIYPECYILFGGHQITYEPSLLDSLPFVDFLSCFEGELSFRCLLKELNGGNLSKVPSLIYRNGNEITATPIKALSADELVSPYLSGTFDHLMNDNMEYIATLETVRGCPFGCAYCDCSLEDRSVKNIPMQRTVAEIDWISNHKIEMCFVIDSNFGINTNDAEKAHRLVKAKELTGYPKKIDVALSKIKSKSAMDTAEILHNADMFNIVTLSVQSTNPETLNAIGRKNIDLDSFRDSIIQYSKSGIMPFTELILGLPLETYDSFSKGFEELILAGQKYYIEVYRCYILPNAALARPESREKYGIKTIKTRPVLHHISPENVNAVSGNAQIVVSTSTMPRQDWIKANLFAITMQSMYFMGLLKYTADYLFRCRHLSYCKFFDGLINWSLCSGSFSKDLFNKFTDIFNDFSDSKGSLDFYDTTFGNLIWFTEEGMFLEIIKNFDLFFNDIGEYLKHIGIEEDILSELLRYQKLMIYLPGKSTSAEIFSYDFNSFFNDESSELRKKKTAICIEQNSSFDNYADYAREIVWYKRKYGGTLCSKSNCNIIIKEMD